MRWVLLLTLAGCGNAEPAAPSWNRCFDMDTEERVSCCYKAGQRDCAAGFMAIEALHGPQNGAQPQDAADFALQCDEDMDGEGADLYCAGYCASCPDYVSWWDVTGSDSDWAGEESTGDDWKNVCYCSAFVEDTTHVRCQ